MINFFKGSFIGLLGWFLGGRDGLMNVLITFIIIDYIMGVMVGWEQHKLSSSVGFKGIFKKVSIIFLIGIAHIIDVHVFHSEAALRTPIILFYIANEGISIIENADGLGIQIPKFLKTRLLDLKEKESQ